VIGKLTDGVSMIWASLDERERFIALYGCAVLVYLIASALSMPRKRAAGDDVEPAPAAPVVGVVRDRAGF
jgi:hypothetical protein